MRMLVISVNWLITLLYYIQTFIKYFTMNSYLINYFATEVAR